MDERSHTPSPDPADIAACRALLHRHARSFHAASMLLPRSVRDPASVLYGFCRIADDAVDAPEAGADRHAAVAALRDRLARAFEGTPRATPIDRALAAVVAHHRIPRLLLERLLEGLEWDADGRRYETLEDLFDYASRVAGAVGAMMAVLMGVRSANGLARACDLGVAMQLSNIARDVAEDAGMGRLYLPMAWLREAGIDPDRWPARPVHSTALESVVRRLLAQADMLYARASAGVAALPLACRPGINAARLLYAAIGHQVARDVPRSLSRRTVVPPPAACCCWHSRSPRPGLPRARWAMPGLAANEAMVRAASIDVGARGTRRPVRRRPVHAARATRPACPPRVHARSAALSLLAIGLSHGSASVDARGRFAIPADALSPSVQGLRDHLGQGKAEAAILSTCNRTELYIAANDERCLKAPALDWLAARGGWACAQLAVHAYVLEGTEAARHAFRVASGLDSQVLGEPMILGQLKQAVRAAETAGGPRAHVAPVVPALFLGGQGRADAPRRSASIR